MSHASQRHVFFYTANDKGLAEALRPLAAMFPDSAPSAMSRPDPSGDMYTQFVLPDDWQMEFIQNHRVCEVMLSQGDNPEKERPIEHLALFTTELGRERFASRARELGYRVKPIADDASAGEGDDKVYPIEFEHTGPTDPFDLTDRTTILADEAMEQDGEYDGSSPTKPWSRTASTTAGRPSRRPDTLARHATDLRPLVDQSRLAFAERGPA
jgi:hypothetical protein